MEGEGSLPRREEGLWKRKGTLLRPPVAQRAGGIYAGPWPWERERRVVYEGSWLWERGSSVICKGSLRWEREPS
eukprot:3762258-Pyramimonas_sp.AAC.1